MTKLHEAAQMALDALNKCIGRHYDLAEDASIGDALEALRSALAQQGEQQPVALQWVAEMIMSDCGCSTNNQRLLERVIARIEQYERANTAAPAAQQGADK